MAELADAADSKSAGTWDLGGSIPPPGTTPKPAASDHPTYRKTASYAEVGA